MKTNCQFRHAALLPLGRFVQSFGCATMYRKAHTDRRYRNTLAFAPTGQQFSAIKLLMQPRTMKTIAAILSALTLFVIVTVWMFASPLMETSSAQQPVIPDTQYAGATVCAECHNS